MSSAFIRALSPAIGAIPDTMVGIAESIGDNPRVPPGELRRNARHSAIMGANATNEIIELIPADYRQLLADPLHALAALVDKLHHSRTTLAKWREHASAGTFPSHLKGSAPKIQLVKEFEGSPDATASKAALETAYKEFLTASLTASIKAKKDEVACLEREVSPEQAWTSLRAVVAAQAPSILARNKLPTEHMGPDGATTVTGWETSPAALAIRDHVLEDCVAYAMRVASITESSLAHRALKMKKKKDLSTAARTAAGDTDVVMADATSSVKSLVDKAVSSALKGMSISPNASKKRKGGPGAGSNKPGGKKNKSDLIAAAKVSSARSSFIAISDHLSLGQIRSRDRQTARRETPVRPASLPSFKVPKLNTRRGQEDAERKGQRQRQASWGRQAKGKGKAKVKGQVDTWRSAYSDSRAVEGPSISGGSNPVARASGPSVHNFRMSKSRPGIIRDRNVNPGSFIAEGDLWVSNPSLIPDYLLSLPVPKAIDYIVSRMSLEMISNLSYQQDVHQSPGVHLPKELSYQISVGAKYMFHEPSKVELIEKSWQDFNRRLRWRIHTLFDDSGKQPYDPDYDVRPRSNKSAPALPLYIELGLVKGRVFVYEAMRKVPDAKTLRHPHTSLTPDVRTIRSFLLDKDYVITGTDKNLGIAVSQRSWIIEKSQDILSDVNNYRCLEHDEAIQILNEKCSEMESLAQLAKRSIDYLEGSVSDFLRSKVTLRGEGHHIPHFYGIPKIHKQPVKMRPIIPCHSAIQNPAAKYVSKKLKPLIQEAATVIHGTKDLAQKLSHLSINPRRKWYIVTGDVVAFYPNIPLNHCIDIVYNMYYEFYWNVATHDHRTNIPSQMLFKRCLEVGNTRLLTQFQNKIYEQLNGLAMGVASSPDLANLYGYYFEKRAKILDHPDIFFYGRYIDDCLAIVYAESDRQAIDLLSGLVKFDNCVITWDCSESHQPFLDMTLYKDSDNNLQHMPYRKNGNHQERIPWISSHPYDVKRGTFLGEMSRLATLSSLLEHYLAAMRGLVALYLRRGYPADEVHKWLYSNLSRRWNERLTNKPVIESSDILVLKTQYNLAWNYFNSHQLGDTIFGYWREWLNRADAGEFNQEFPAPSTSDPRVSDWSADQVVGRWDLRETSIFNSKVILSRKRTRNFLDLTNLWKKSVIENLEELTLDDLVNNAARFAALKRPLIPDVNTAVVGPRLKRTRVATEEVNSDNEVEHVAHRSSSPTPTGSGWASAPMGTWGRGSRR